jgi:hypothetical protein
MVIPTGRTFDYVAVVPAAHQPGGTSVVWDYGIRDRAGEAVDRLLGPRPLLEIWDGIVLLRAARLQRAGAHAALFMIDAELVRLFQPGDEFSLAYTAVAGLGLSLVRDSQLIFAAGQVTAVPLGKAFAVRNVVLGPPGLRPWQDVVVEVTAPGEGQQLRAGQNVRVGGYDVSVERCLEDGMPGRPECLAVSLSNAWPHEAVVRTAKFRAGPGGGLRCIDWPASPKPWWQLWS